MSESDDDPKYIQVAAAIEAEVRGGDWYGKRLPSVRGIAKQYQVSVVTASRALQVLRDKGLIHTIERSGCYRVPPPTAARWALCMRVTPSPWQRQIIGMVRDGFEAIARRDSIHIEVDAFDVQPSTPKAEYVRAAKSAQEDGVLGAVLLPSRTGEDETRAEELFLAGCTEAGLPVVLLERGLRNRPLPRNHDLVALDDVGAARHCTEYLLGLGRKKIGLVVASPTSSHNDRVAGYLFALHHAFGLTHPGGHVHVIRQPTEVPSREAFSQVTTQLLTLGCDAVICYQDYLALGVLMELLQRQIPVPEQLAVVGFDNMPFGEAFNLGLTSYKYPAEAMADHAIRLLRDRVAAPDRPAVKLLVPGELIVRASTERD